MSSKSPRRMEDDRRLAERAAEWVTVLADASAEERAEFIQWIKDSPEHLREFLLASAVVRGLDGIDLQSLARMAEERGADAPNVVHLPHAPPDGVRTHTSYIRRIKPWGLAAAAALLVLAVATGWWHWFAGTKTYTTGIGEQRTIQLGEGSVIQLNVGSRVEVLLTEQTRSIQLLQGEAMFKVGRDPRRPFRVHAAGNVIQALGTQFNVRRRPSGTTVSVIEGLVGISDGARPHDTRLAAGEEARIGLDGKIEQRALLDVATVATWRHNRLDFRAEKLIDIAAEFNRYNEAPRIVIEDEGVGARRYSGVFDAHDPRSLADFLREDADLLVEERKSAIVILRKQPEPGAR